jgi:periplasmic divalent cation tolerance protein
MSSYIEVITTVDTKEAAEAMARRLVDEKLAACVQVSGPVKSTYRWKEAVETTAEWQCHIKTDRHHYSAIEKRIKEIHPYELPEIIVLPILNGSREYLNWISEQVT